MKLEVGKKYTGKANNCDYFTFTVTNIDKERITIIWNAPWEDRQDIKFTSELKTFAKRYNVRKLSKLEQVLK
jgi:hypothetical protein